MRLYSKESVFRLVVTPRFPKYAKAESRSESAPYIREEKAPHMHAKSKVT